MAAIRGVLFDKDGTLVDFNATWSAIARQLAMRAAEGDTQRADALLTLSGYDLLSGRFLADSVFAAGTNAEVVELWHPGLEREELRRVTALYDEITAREGGGGGGGEVAAFGDGPGLEHEEPPDHAERDEQAAGPQ